MSSNFNERGERMDIATSRSRLELGRNRENFTKRHYYRYVFCLLRFLINCDNVVLYLIGTTLRMKSVTRQDVFNVCRSHGGMNLQRRDPDDNCSVKIWVEELRSKSSVLIWNPEDGVLPLLVMSENQAILARLHGRIIFVADIPFAWEQRYHRLIALIGLSSTDGSAYLLTYAITDQKGLEALQVILIY